MAKRTRPIKGLERRYSWRLYPRAEQQETMLLQMKMCADLWNALLSMCEHRYGRAVQRNGKAVSFHCHRCAALSNESGKMTMCEDHRHPSEFSMGYWITAMLAECPEWRSMSTWTPRRVATSMAAAWQAFLGGGGYPRYKARARSTALPHRCCSGCRLTKSPLHKNSWTVKMKGIPGEVWARREQPSEFHEWMDADVRYSAGRWTISVAIDVEPYKEISKEAGVPMAVKFDLIDGLATVNGVLETPEGLVHAQVLDETKIHLQSEFDMNWPRGKRWNDDEWHDRCQDKAEIGRIAARIARVRKDALHTWTKHIIDRASMVTVTKPRSIKSVTASPRGNKKNWGAAVETVSSLNRNILSYAPARAVQMLQYKAEEAGIRCTVLEDASPIAGASADLITAGKALRRARRKGAVNDPGNLKLPKRPDQDRGISPRTHRDGDRNPPSE